jgi:hypothetical protein
MQKMYLQKVVSRKPFFVKISFLLISWRSMKKKEDLDPVPHPHPDPDPKSDLDPLVWGMDPRIRIRNHTKNAMDLQHWF